MGFFNFNREFGRDEIRALAGLCAGAAALIGIAFLFSELDENLPGQIPVVQAATYLGSAQGLPSWGDSTAEGANTNPNNRRTGGRPAPIGCTYAPVKRSTCAYMGHVNDFTTYGMFSAYPQGNLSGLTKYFTARSILDGISLHWMWRWAGYHTEPESALGKAFPGISGSPWSFTIKEAGSPINVPSGSPVVLEWRCQEWQLNYFEENCAVIGYQSCTKKAFVSIFDTAVGTNFSTGGARDGSTVVYPTEDTTYSLSCRTTPEWHWWSYGGPVGAGYPKNDSGCMQTYYLEDPDNPYPYPYYSPAVSGNAEGCYNLISSKLGYSAPTLSIPITVGPPTPPPPPPTGLQHTCSSSNTRASLSWNASSGATSYNVRLNDLSNDTIACAGKIDGWYCPGTTDRYEDGVTGTSVSSWTVNPDTVYSWWVHSVGPGGISGPAAENNWTCGSSTTQSVSVSAPDAIATEGQSPADNATFRVSRSSSAGSVTVNFSMSGTGARNTDYTLSGCGISGSSGTSASLSSGVSSCDVTVAPRANNSTYEGDKIVTMTITSGTGYTVAASPGNSATVTVKDDDSAPPSTPTCSISPQNSTVSSGGSTMLNYTISGSASSASITCNAQTGASCTSPGSTSTVSPGSKSTGTLNNTTSSNKLVTFTMSVSNASGSSSCQTSVTVTPAVSNTITISRARDATEDPSYATSSTGGFLITRTGSTASAVTVSFSLPSSTNTASRCTDVVSPGLCNPATDYTLFASGFTSSSYFPGGADCNDLLTSGTSFSIPAGLSSCYVVVRPVNNTTYEPTETVTLALSAPSGYTLGTPSYATVQIYDDEPPPPEVSITAIQPNAAEPSTNGRFRITRSVVSSSALAVNFSLQTGSGYATRCVQSSCMSSSFINSSTCNENTTSSGACIDYRFSGGSITTSGTTTTIPGNAAYVDVTVVVIDDTKQATTTVDGVERVRMFLTGCPNNSCTISETDNYATVYIADNDAPVAPTVSLSVPDSTAKENPLETGRFRVTRTTTSGDLTVSFSRSGSATHGVDYDPIGTSVTIPSGASSADIIITPIPDSLVEGSETVTLALAASSNYIIHSTDNQGMVTIEDGDIAVPQGGEPPGSVSFFTATPARVRSGSPVYLTWTTSNVLACEVRSGTGSLVSTALNSSGTQTPVVVTSNMVYRLSCTDAFGPLPTYSVTVDILPFYREI